MTEQQFYAISKWQDKTFPKTTALSAIKHLQKEVEKELIPELENGKIPNIDEYADLLFLIFQSARKCGYDWFDIIVGIEDKFDVNKARDWNEPDKDGVYLHKKEAYNPPPFTEGHNPFDKGGVYTPGDPGL